MKPLAHALLIAGILNAIDHVPLRPGITLALDLVRPGAFTIIAASSAAALHQRRSIILVILALTVIVAYPFDLPEFAALLIPLGSGIVLGGLARTAWLEEQPRGGTHDAASR